MQRTTFVAIAMGPLLYLFKPAGSCPCDLAYLSCELLPVDDHEIFADLDAQTLAALLPQSVVDEYVRDGKPSDPNNPQSPPYWRKLRDYEGALRMLSLKRAELIDQLASLTADKNRLDAALADAQREEQTRDQEIAQLKQELSRKEHERDLAQNHLKAVEDTLARVTAARDQVIQQNLKTAEELARAQLKSRDLVEQRVRSMARGSATALQTASQ
ncbi:MAG: hypothetical protein ACUVQH_11740 [Thermogutta sp.]